jgi:hypothetical protein
MACCLARHLGWKPRNQRRVLRGERQEVMLSFFSYRPHPLGPPFNRPKRDLTMGANGPLDSSQGLSLRRYNRHGCSPPNIKIITWRYASSHHQLSQLAIALVPGNQGAAEHRHHHYQDTGRGDQPIPRLHRDCCRPHGQARRPAEPVHDDRRASLHISTETNARRRGMIAGAKPQSSIHLSIIRNIPSRDAQTQAAKERYN